MISIQSNKNKTPHKKKDIKNHELSTNSKRNQIKNNICQIVQKIKHQLIMTIMIKFQEFQKRYFVI